MRWRFIHIPRTGGTAFAEVYGRGTERLNGKGELPAHLPAPFFPMATTFAFIRNPYDRAISLLGYILRMSHGVQIPTKILEQWKQDGYPVFPSEVFCRWADAGFPTAGVCAVYTGDNSGLSFLTPQVDFLAPETIRLRYDRIDEETRRITKQLGMDYVPLPRRNQTLGRPKELCKKGRRIVEEKWAADFEELSEYWERNQGHGQ